jgi:hypothetical protein
MFMMPKRVFTALAVIVVVIILLTTIWFIFDYMSKASSGRFGTFLSETGELVISDNDIVWYNKSSHEIKLTEEGAKKIGSLKVPVEGIPFVVRLNGRDVYNGSFWVMYSSLSYSGIVIDVVMIKDNTIKIECGYPSPGFFEGADLRDNSEVLNYFQKIGKLAE